MHQWLSEHSSGAQSQEVWRYILLATVMYMIQISPWDSLNLHKKCVGGGREGLLLIEIGR